ncbi:MAG: AAA family ATPase [Acidiferrobacter sp.]
MPGKATVCIGVRRRGKSTFMFQLMKKLQGSGVARQNILYLNLFDARLHDLQHDNLGVILEAYFSLYPEKRTPRRFIAFSTKPI